MMLYLDTSALVKRYVDEEGSLEVIGRRWARRGDGRPVRVGYVETARALMRSAEGVAVERFQADWSSFNVVELDMEVAEDAAELAVAARLRSLDAIHLASALAIDDRRLTVATWDARLHEAAGERGLALLPESLAA